MQNSLQSDEKPEEDAGLLPQLYASRIGPRAQAYYLAQFKRFDALDRSLPSWNMAAAFFTLAWCCLRGLWLEAAKYLAAVTVVALIWWMGLRPALPHAMALGVGAALWLVAMAVPGLLANGWYWRKIKAETLQAITAAPNMAQAHAELQAQASPAQNKARRASTSGTGSAAAVPAAPPRIQCASDPSQTYTLTATHHHTEKPRAK